MAVGDICLKSSGNVYQAAHDSAVVESSSRISLSSVDRMNLNSDMVENTWF